MEEENARSNLSEKQIITLDKFREKVKDVLKPEHDDFYLLRWLRAREYDLKKSEDMLRKSVAWREKWRVDTLLTDWTPPEALTKYFPVGFVGYDKEGCPVWVFPGRNLHMKSMSMSVKKSDIIRYNICIMEKVHKQCQEQSAKLGRRVDKAVLLDDLDGFTMKQLFMPGMDIIFKFLGMIEANYPESLKFGFIVNGPMIFPIIYNLVKPLLSEHTKKKIRVLGKDWKEVILQHIPPDQLPVHWGGTDCDPDGDTYCQSRICMGGEVPAELYLKNSHLVADSKVTMVTIPRGDSLELKYTVDQPRMALRWVFWTESYDVKFSVSYCGAEGKKCVDRVVPAERVGCHHVPEDGLLECDQLGVYTVKFDNSYSWVHSKRLSYSVETVHMDELQSDRASVASSRASLASSKSSGSLNPGAGAEGGMPDTGTAQGS